jgi:hypothetical protein
MRMLFAAVALCAVVGLAPRRMPTVIRVTDRSRRRQRSSAAPDERLFVRASGKELAVGTGTYESPSDGERA